MAAGIEQVAANATQMATAGQQTRAIKALSSEDIEELRSGAGMGRFTAHDPKPTST